MIHDSIKDIRMRRTLRSNKKRIEEVMAKHGGRNPHFYRSGTGGRFSFRDDLDMIVELDDPPMGNKLVRTSMSDDLRRVLGVRVNVVDDDTQPYERSRLRNSTELKL